MTKKDFFQNENADTSFRVQKAAIPASSAIAFLAVVAVLASTLFGSSPDIDAIRLTIMPRWRHYLFPEPAERNAFLVCVLATFPACLISVYVIRSLFDPRTMAQSDITRCCGKQSSDG